MRRASAIAISAKKKIAAYADMSGDWVGFNDAKVGGCMSVMLATA